MTPRKEKSREVKMAEEKKRGGNEKRAEERRVQMWTGEQNGEKKQRRLP